MINVWKLFVTLCAVLALLGMAACESMTQAQLVGVLQNVDSISGEVTVKLKDGGTITFNLKDVNVETLRKVVGAASLEAGSQVILETDRDKKVKTVKVHHAEVEGVIKSLDVIGAKQYVKISVEKGGEVILEVTPATKIEVEDHGEIATFASLREDQQIEGQQIEAKYDIASEKALKIEIKEEETKGKLKGTIIAIGKHANGVLTVTILAKNGTKADYRVTPSTKLDLDGAGTFYDLKAGMKVKAKVNRANDELIKLELED